MAKKLSSLADLGGLVYSTDQGRLCPDCGKAIADCVCKQNTIPSGDGVVRIRRETKGRGGKTVTALSGFCLAEEDLKELATVLKRRCGSGGTLKDGVIEIQGDHVALLLTELVNKGFKAKKSGG